VTFEFSSPAIAAPAPTVASISVQATSAQMKRSSLTGLKVWIRFIVMSFSVCAFLDESTVFMVFDGWDLVCDERFRKILRKNSIHIR